MVGVGEIMKLISYRIKHYKSIDDSGDCILASDVTVLAGKNEAGKTNLLEALEKFNHGAAYNFEKTDYSLDGGGVEPEVTCKFVVTEVDLEQFKERLKLDNIPNPKQLAKIPIIITKKADNQYYFESPSGSITDFIDSQENKPTEVQTQLTELKEALKKDVEVDNITLAFIAEDKPFNAENITELSNQVGQILPPLSPEKQTLYKDYLTKIQAKFNEAQQATKEIVNRKELLIKSLPKMILFNSFDQEELLPYEPTLEEAQKNKAVKNYCTIAGLNLQEVIDTKDTQLRRKLIGDKAVIIQGDFGEYWKQDEINLFVSSSSDGLLFGIKERGKTYEFKIQQRSKGLQWFLSFYLLVKAEASTKQNVILIDEPGLYVHAKAQWDILRVLSDLSKGNQIIFSTHSPYLIDPTRLDRIRLVIKNLEHKKNKRVVKEQGSKVYELSSIPTADKDTLTPIITAIGLDITKQLSFASEHNVVLEGISDYNFLRGFIESLPKTKKSKYEKIHLIPCKGADNVPTIISLLLGFGFSFRALLDNDEKGREVATILKDKFLLEDEEIVFVSNNGNCCIEDVFDGKDFNKYVLKKDENDKLNELNSVKIPDSKKAIASREFLNLVRNKKVNLSKITKDNFTKLLNQLINDLIG